MNEPDTPPPFDESRPEPSGQQQASPTPPIQEKPALNFSTTAPPLGNIPLGQGKLQASDEKTMGMLAHILGAVTNFVGPLIIWLIKKDESPFVDDQGREALNFQITILLGYVASGILTFVPILGCLTVLLFPAIGIVGLIFGILGGLEANKGVSYRYPFAFRLIN